MKKSRTTKSNRTANIARLLGKLLEANPPTKADIRRVMDGTPLNVTIERAERLLAKSKAKGSK